MYCGQTQRTLDENQTEIMRQIAEYIINEGAITPSELNSFDTDLWRKAIISFGVPTLTSEIETLSKFLLKAA